MSTKVETWKWGKDNHWRKVQTDVSIQEFATHLFLWLKATSDPSFAESVARDAKEMTARKKWPREILKGRIRISCGQFSSRFSFGVTRDGLIKWGTTCSLFCFRLDFNFICKIPKYWPHSFATIQCTCKEVMFVRKSASEVKFQVSSFKFYYSTSCSSTRQFFKSNLIFETEKAQEFPTVWKCFVQWFLSNFRNNSAWFQSCQSAWRLRPLGKIRSGSPHKGPWGTNSNTNRWKGGSWFKCKYRTGQNLIPSCLLQNGNVVQLKMLHSAVVTGIVLC